MNFILKFYDLSIELLNIHNSYLVNYFKLYFYKSFFVVNNSILQNFIQIITKTNNHEVNHQIEWMRKTSFHYCHSDHYIKINENKIDCFYKKGLDFYTRKHSTLNTLNILLTKIQEFFNSIIEK